MPERDVTATLYYDGHCSLCQSEMARLGRLKSDKLQLADIHARQGGDDLPDTDTLLRNLHLRLPDGRWVTGVEANVEAWSYTRYGVWFRWLRWPFLRPLTDRVYRYWAQWRYDRLYTPGCTDQRKTQHAPD